VFWRTWRATLTAKRPEITLHTTDQFVTKMFETNPDFVFTVTRDFVRSCQNPVLILPDDVPAHPYAVAMECAMLAPKAEVSMFPWKEPKDVPVRRHTGRPALRGGLAARRRGAGNIGDQRGLGLAGRVDEVAPASFRRN